MEVFQHPLLRFTYLHTCHGVYAYLQAIHTGYEARPADGSAETARVLKDRVRFDDTSYYLQYAEFCMLSISTWPWHYLAVIRAGGSASVARRMWLCLPLEDTDWLEVRRVGQAPSFVRFWIIADHLWRLLKKRTGGVDERGVYVCGISIS